MTISELNNMKLEVGKIYEIEFIIPNEYIVDQKKLSKMLTQIQTGLINHKDIDTMQTTGKLIANKLIIPFKVRPTSTLVNRSGVSGLGLIPILAYAMGVAIISIFVGLGLNWTVSAIREVVAPVKDIVSSTTKDIIPVLIVIAVILLTPTLLQYIPKERK